MTASQNQRHLLFLRQILPHISAIFFRCACVAYPLLSTKYLIGIVWLQEQFFNQVKQIKTKICVGQMPPNPDPFLS